MKHPHAEALIAVANGEEDQWEIQLRGDNDWRPLAKYCAWVCDTDKWEVRKKKSALEIYISAAYPNSTDLSAYVNPDHMQRGLDAVIKAIKNGEL